MYNFQLLIGEDTKKLAHLLANAYTAVATVSQYEERLLLQDANPATHFCGVYKDSTLVGGMRLHDYTMNILGTMIEVGGVGSIAVDMCHKKHHVAYEIIKYFLYQLREQGKPMAILYAFNPGFYKKMGFGICTQIDRFTVKPSDLPSMGDRSGIRLLTADDSLIITEFYNKRVGATNGMIKMTQIEWENMLKRPNQAIYGCIVKGALTGYIVTSPKESEGLSPFVNDLVVSDILFDKSCDFYSLMSFLHSQSDQFRHIILNIQDSDAIFAISDPRSHPTAILTSVFHHCTDSGLGLLCRITDVGRLFSLLAPHNFAGQSLSLRLCVKDTFISENNKTYFVDFSEGFAKIRENEGENLWDCSLEIDIEHLSSLIFSSVSLKSLVKFGLARLSDESFLDKLNLIFSTCDKAKCYTKF